MLVRYLRTHFQDWMHPAGADVTQLGLSDRDQIRCYCVAKDWNNVGPQSDCLAGPGLEQVRRPCAAATN
jgi:hypothetical protein